MKARENHYLHLSLCILSQCTLNSDTPLINSVYGRGHVTGVGGGRGNGGSGEVEMGLSTLMSDDGTLPFICV